MIWFRTSNYNDKIESVEVLRETDLFIYITGWNGKEKRVAKASAYDRYHKSWSEARGYLQQKHQSAIDRLETTLAGHRKSLELLEALAAG